MNEKFVDYYKDNKNNLLYWFPKIEHCGIPVPRTLIFETPDDVAKAYFELNNTNREIVRKFVEETIMPKLPQDMWRLFIKNGTFSDKFSFKFCDCTKDSYEISESLICINYDAEMFGAGGLSEIVIRDFIGKYHYINENIPCIYQGMPLRPEFRVFYDFDTHKVLYSVNYWDWDYCSKDICRNATDKIVYTEHYPVIETFYKEHKEEVENLIQTHMNGVELDGIWSIDLMWCEEYQQYYLIDMALAQNSAYWQQI